MTISFEEYNYLSMVSFALQKGRGRTITQFVVFNMRVYNSYMLSLSKEPARDLRRVRNELRQLNLYNYIAYCLLDNHPIKDDDIRCLADLLKDNFVDYFTEKKKVERLG